MSSCGLVPEVCSGWPSPAQLNLPLILCVAKSLRMSFSSFADQSVSARTFPLSKICSDFAFVFGRSFPPRCQTYNKKKRTFEKGLATVATRDLFIDFHHVGLAISKRSTLEMHAAKDFGRLITREAAGGWAEIRL